jgi:hypothetical protein
MSFNLVKERTPSALVPIQSTKPMSFNLVNERTPSALGLDGSYIASNSTVRMGNNNSNVNSVVKNNFSGSSRLLENDIKSLKDDFKTFRDQYNEDRQTSEKHRKDMYSNYLTIINLINNVKTEQEQMINNFLKEMNSNNQSNNFSRSSNQSNNYINLSNQITTGIHVKRPENNENEYQSVEYEVAYSIVKNSFVPYIIAAVNDENSLLNKVL